MNITIEDEIMPVSYPDEEEIRKAVRICCGRCCKACESPVEYAWRKRRTDLAALLGVAIENELTDREKTVIKDLFYNGMTVTQVANRDGVSTSAVSLVAGTAKEKLKKALRYVIMYQNDTLQDDLTENFTADAVTLSRASHIKGETIGERVRNRRISAGLSVKKLGALTSLEEGRIYRIEGGTVLPDAGELMAFCGVFGVTPNELML